MEILYSSNKVRLQCTSVKEAKKLFGGDAILTRSLLARITALESSETLKDIILQPPFRFHSLSNKNGRNLNGFFAIDVKTRREKWRIIFQPLDENKNPYVPCYIDQIASYVKIVEVTEVSSHYE